MESLYDTNTYERINSRLSRLNPASRPTWGKMDVGQMLQHCSRTFKFALSDKPTPRSLMGILMGWAFKKQLYNETAWKQGLPTAPQLRVTDKRNFDEELKNLQKNITEFYTRGPGKTGMFPHPMFGRFTKEQWGQMMYKHLDHHFRQFGV